MNPLPSDPYIELHVPDAKTEQEFLQLAVQAAVLKYRALHRKDSSPPQQVAMTQSLSDQALDDRQDILTTRRGTA